MKQIRNNDILFLEDLLIEIENRHNKEIDEKITQWCETPDECIEYERTRREKEKRLKSIILRLRENV